MPHKRPFPCKYHIFLRFLKPLFVNSSWQNSLNSCFVIYTPLKSLSFTIQQLQLLTTPSPVHTPYSDSYQIFRNTDKILVKQYWKKMYDTPFSALSTHPLFYRHGFDLSNNFCPTPTSVLDLEFLSLFFHIWDKIWSACL